MSNAHVSVSRKRSAATSEEPEQCRGGKRSLIGAAPASVLAKPLTLNWLSMELLERIIGMLSVTEQILIRRVCKRLDTAARRRLQSITLDQRQFKFGGSRRSGAKQQQRYGPYFEDSDDEAPHFVVPLMLALKIILGQYGRSVKNLKIISRPSEKGAFGGRGGSEDETDLFIDLILRKCGGKESRLTDLELRRVEGGSRVTYGVKKKAFEFGEIILEKLSRMRNLKTLRASVKVNWGNYVGGTSASDVDAPGGEYVENGGYLDEEIGEDEEENGEIGEGDNGENVGEESGDNVEEEMEESVEAKNGENVEDENMENNVMQENCEIVKENGFDSEADSGVSKLSETPGLGLGRTPSSSTTIEKSCAKDGFAAGAVDDSNEDGDLDTSRGMEANGLGELDLDDHESDGESQLENTEAVDAADGEPDCESAQALVNLPKLRFIEKLVVDQFPKGAQKSLFWHGDVVGNGDLEIKQLRISGVASDGDEEGTVRPPTKFECFQGLIGITSLGFSNITIESLGFFSCLKSMGCLETLKFKHCSFDTFRPETESLAGLLNIKKFSVNGPNMKFFNFSFLGSWTKLEELHMETVARFCSDSFSHIPSNAPLKSVKLVEVAAACDRTLTMLIDRKYKLELLAFTGLPEGAPGAPLGADGGELMWTLIRQNEQSLIVLNLARNQFVDDRLLSDSVISDHLTTRLSSINLRGTSVTEEQCTTYRKRRDKSCGKVGPDRANAAGRYIWNFWFMNAMGQTQYISSS